jgi:hypothetical protein
MLRIDEARGATAALNLSDCVQSDGGLARGLRAKHLNNAAARISTTRCSVQR